MNNELSPLGKNEARAEVGEKGLKEAPGRLRVNWSLKEAIHTCDYQLRQFVILATLTPLQKKRLTEIQSRLLKDLKAALAAGEPEFKSANDIPLCANHAESWFCERNHWPNPDAPCILCAMQPATAPATALREAAERVLTEIDIHCSAEDGGQFAKDIALLARAALGATAGTGHHKLVHLLLETLACKKGCGWKTQSKCSAEIGEQCECKCHVAWAGVDALMGTPAPTEEK